MWAAPGAPLLGVPVVQAGGRRSDVEKTRPSPPAPRVTTGKDDRSRDHPGDLPVLDKSCAWCFPGLGKQQGPEGERSVLRSRARPPAMASSRIPRLLTSSADPRSPLRTDTPNPASGGAAGYDSSGGLPESGRTAPTASSPPAGGPPAAACRHRPGLTTCLGSRKTKGLRRMGERSVAAAAVALPLLWGGPPRRQRLREGPRRYGTGTVAMAMNRSIAMTAAE